MGAEGERNPIQRPNGCRDVLLNLSGKRTVNDQTDFYLFFSSCKKIHRVLLGIFFDSPAAFWMRKTYIGKALPAAGM